MFIRAAPPAISAAQLVPMADAKPKRVRKPKQAASGDAEEKKKAMFRWKPPYVALMLSVMKELPVPPCRHAGVKPWEAMVPILASKGRSHLIALIELTRSQVSTLLPSSATINITISRATSGR